MRAQPGQLLRISDAAWVQLNISSREVAFSFRESGRCATGSYDRKAKRRCIFVGSAVLNQLQKHSVLSLGEVNNRPRISVACVVAKIGSPLPATLI